MSGLRAISLTPPSFLQVNAGENGNIRPGSLGYYNLFERGDRQRTGQWRKGLGDEMCMALDPSKCYTNEKIIDLFKGSCWRLETRGCGGNIDFQYVCKKYFQPLISDPDKVRDAAGRCWWPGWSGKCVTLRRRVLITDIKNPLVVTRRRRAVTRRGRMFGGYMPGRRGAGARFGRPFRRGYMPV